VVGVGRVETVHDERADVGLVVAVGVLEEDDVRLLREDDAAVVELEARKGQRDAYRALLESGEIVRL